MKRLFEAILTLFASKQNQPSFSIREDKEFGGYVASTTHDPMVRATGDTEQEALKNLLDDVAEIKRMNEKAVSQKDSRNPGKLAQA